MGRLKNSVETKQITLSVTPQVFDLLDRLSVTGLYGSNPSQTAAELLRVKLRELCTQPGMFGVGPPGAAVPPHAPATPGPV